jgi:hypothetical protein
LPARSRQATGSSKCTEQHIGTIQDGSVSTADFDELIVNVIGTRRGDADLNGKVDFDDFVTLSSNFGALGGWSDGDSDGNGVVDFADFVLLANNFGFDRT